jgi:ketosteroid isomerase-like protein
VPITPADVEAATRQWGETFQVGDLDGVARMESQAGGFGYRSAAPRFFGNPDALDGYRQLLQRVWDSFASYAVEWEEIRTAVHGDVGFAWGSFFETFQHHGQRTERAHVRFSQAMVRTEDGWRVLMFHRDIQPFGEDGRYLPALTETVQPEGAG